MACAWLKNFTSLQKKKKKTTNNPATNMQASCYFVSTSYFINFLNWEAHNILAAQIYPAAPQKAQVTVPTLCKLRSVEIVDTICYLQ